MTTAANARNPLTRSGTSETFRSGTAGVVVCSSFGCPAKSFSATRGTTAVSAIGAFIWAPGHNQPACVVGALAPYNHSVPLAGVPGHRFLIAWSNGLWFYQKLFVAGFSERGYSCIDCTLQSLAELSLAFSNDR